MHKQDRAGFTLIELIIVMAISSMLVVIAFVGQRGLRSRAQFDAAVDKVVASIGQARTEATAGVNITGAGNGTAGCTGTPGQWVFGGTAWTADTAGSPSAIKVDYYKVLPGSASCVFDSRTVSLPATVSVKVGPPPGLPPGGRILYVRTDNGGVVVCPVNNLTTDVRTSFTAGSCSVGTLTFTFSDADGHVSRVDVDSSGLAKRVN